MWAEIILIPEKRLHGGMKELSGCRSLNALVVINATLKYFNMCKRTSVNAIYRMINALEANGGISVSLQQGFQCLNFLVRLYNGCRCVN
jgi:hypothetical protein